MKPTKGVHKEVKQPTTRQKPKVSAREAAMDILTRVEEDRSYSNLLLNRTLQKLELSRADAGLTTELVYGTIQRLNTIDHYLGRFLTGGLDKLQPWVRSLLRLSFYQLYYLDRIPSHAAVSEAVNVAKKRGHLGISGMVNGVLRNVIRQKEQLKPQASLSDIKRIALSESHPEWLVARYVHRYGVDVTEQICAANNKPPHSSIRVNRLKGLPEDVAGKLREEGLKVFPSALAESGLVVEGGGNLAFSMWYEQGKVSVQDESSMLVAEAVAPEAGMQVLDCCAAPGGKTAHMAEIMGDRGQITACDVHEHKEKLISTQAKRLGLSSIHTIVADARELGQKLPAESYDRILLDAPCSGLGVIRRKPELKWYKQEKDIQAVANLQKELLEAVHGLLKPGGILVYSTCTTEPEENANRVKTFLADHTQYALAPFPEHFIAMLGSTTNDFDESVESNQPQKPTPARLHELKQQAQKGMLQLLPSDFGTDGFFIARLSKMSEPMLK
ncbi:MAG: 16S rRNA (cytosine(967)-C(5))-methyltransferase RsmB [Gorillibacterium sp.]|nr:16S rRNA (cytosine(967)-C(5))-methyltransferase RsmB [Gorillibacterium sp.]